MGIGFGEYHLLLSGPIGCSACCHVYWAQLQITPNNNHWWKRKHVQMEVFYFFIVFWNGTQKFLKSYVVSEWQKRSFNSNLLLVNDTRSEVYRMMGRLFSKAWGYKPLFWWLYGQLWYLPTLGFCDVAFTSKIFPLHLRSTNSWFWIMLVPYQVSSISHDTYKILERIYYTRFELC